MQTTLTDRAKRYRARKREAKSNPWPFSRSDARRTTPASGGIAYHQSRKPKVSAKDGPSGTHKGYTISRTADGEYFSSLDPDSWFETKAQAKAHIDRYLKGRGNPSKFDRCVKDVKAKGGAANAYAVCTAAGTRGNPGSDYEVTMKDLFGKVYSFPIFAESASGARMAAISGSDPSWRIVSVKPMRRRNPLAVGTRNPSLDAVRAMDEYGTASGSGKPSAVTSNIERSFREAMKDFGKVSPADRKQLRGVFFRAYRSAAGRRNPAAASAEVFEEFHGYAPSEVITVTKHVHHHEHLAAAGKLTHLDVWGVDGRGHKISGFKGALLAFNEEKNQLFVEGGDQSVNLGDYGIRKAHEFETLGKVTDIGYHTNKTHLGDEGGEAIYVHKFRSTNENGKHVIVKIAREPDLIYDARNESLMFSGGSYEILREGIDR
jgi:hypothetical protein